MLFRSDLDLLSRSLDHRVGKSKSTQVSHQADKVAIAGSAAIGLHNRQGEAGALEERSPLAYVNEGGNARGGAAKHLGFCDKPSLPQFSQRVAAEGGGQENSIRFQCSLDLGQHTWNVIGAFETQDMNTGFQAVGRKRKSLRIEHQTELGPVGDIACDDFSGRAQVAYRSFQNGGSGTVHKHGSKRPVYDGQALRKLGSDNAVQKLWLLLQETATPPAQECAIEYGRRYCHNPI